MKTKKRIRRLLRELQELESASSDGRLSGIVTMGPQPDAGQYLNTVHWTRGRGIGS